VQIFRFDGPISCLGSTWRPRWSSLTSRPGTTTLSGEKAGRAREPFPSPPQDLRQAPSLRNLLVYSSGVVLEIELQVGDA
jgi:hypothetical protein